MSDTNEMTLYGYYRRLDARGVDRDPDRDAVLTIVRECNIDVPRGLMDAVTPGGDLWCEFVAVHCQRMRDGTLRLLSIDAANEEEEDFEDEEWQGGAPDAAAASAAAYRNSLIQGRSSALLSDWARRHQEYDDIEDEGASDGDVSVEAPSSELSELERLNMDAQRIDVCVEATSSEPSELERLNLDAQPIAEGVEPPPSEPSEAAFDQKSRDILLSGGASVTYVEDTLAAVDALLSGGASPGIQGDRYDKVEPEQSELLLDALSRSDANIAVCAWRWSEIQHIVDRQGYHRWHIVMLDGSEVEINPIPSSNAAEPWLWAVVLATRTGRTLLVEGMAVVSLYETCYDRVGGRPVATNAAGG